MRARITIIFVIAFVQKGFCQYNQVEFAVAASRQQNSFSLFYNHIWRLGKKEKFGVGVGARFTSYLGKRQYYETAPAQLTSESTGPGVIFIDNINANIDSLAVSSPQVNLINLAIDLNYQLSSKIIIGFNIDVIGFSFGGARSVNYIQNGNATSVSASPTSFSLLLVSDNDRGSLNSEFYLNYRLTNNWSLMTAGQFLFTEYTTSYPVQQFPSANDRFRNKSLMFAVGIVRKF